MFPKTFAIFFRFVYTKVKAKLNLLNLRRLMEMKTLSKKRLGILLIAILLAMSMATMFTFSALESSKTATGTITFTGDLALTMTHGNSGDNNTLSLALTPDYNNVQDIASSGNIYLEGMNGMVASLKWPTNASGGSDIKFNVYSNDSTDVYIKFTIELIYTPKSTSNIPQTAQSMLVYPKFGSSNYAMTHTQATVNGNTEFSYYAVSDGMVISYPEFEKTSTQAIKRFNCYYVEFPENSSEATMKAFGPSTTTSFAGYSHLNKSVNFSDIISDIHFVIEGGLSPNDGDKFELKIKCDCAIFPKM